MHCWWGLIRSKQLSSVCVCHAQVFAGFSGCGNSIHKLSVSLINGDSLTFYLFLCLPCCCQCRFQRYIAKQTNSKTEETVPLWHQLAFPTICLLFFPFFLNVANHKLHDSFFLSFFLTSFFLSWKIITENVRDLSFRSFCLPSFLFFISFFHKYYVHRYTDVHTEHYTCVLY